MSELKEKLAERLDHAQEMDRINRRQWRRSMYRIAAKTAAVVVGVTVVSRALSEPSSNQLEESN